MSVKKTIKIPIYFGILTLHEVDDFDEIQDKYKFKDLSAFGAITFRAHHESGYMRYHLAFKKDPSHMTIAHESLHIVNNIFEDRNMVMDVRDCQDESQCYLLGWVVGECYKFLKK